MAIAALLLCCCCCCPPVFVSGITEGVTLASLPPLSPSLSLAVCVYTLVSSTYLSSPGPVLSHPSRTATIKRRKEIKKKGNFFLSQGRAWLSVTAQRTKSNNNNNQKKKKKTNRDSPWRMIESGWTIWADMNWWFDFVCFLFFSIDVM
jgi:hypothetical protein